MTSIYGEWGGNLTIGEANESYPHFYSSNTTHPHLYDYAGEDGEENWWIYLLVVVLKAILMGTVILVSVLGNLLVIVSVIRYHRLRVMTNYFVVSLALADMLVALMAMMFNASVQLTNKWLFGPVMCDIWNAMDVYFSTVSILHLCCISIDRYTAIVQPLDYSLRMTGRTVSFMLTVAWVSPLSISALPIFMGWYTTQDQLELLSKSPDLCEFIVNKVYAVISSSVSFWIPGIIMLVMYFRIYLEADRQEQMMFRSTVASYVLNKKERENHSISVRDDDFTSTSDRTCTNSIAIETKISYDEVIPIETEDNDFHVKKCDSLPKRKSLTNSESALSNSVPNLSQISRDQVENNEKNKDYMKSLHGDKCFEIVNLKYDTNNHPISEPPPPISSIGTNSVCFQQPQSTQNKKTKSKFVKFTKSPKMLKVSQNFKAAKDFKKARQKQFLNLSIKRKSQTAKELSQPSHVVSADERKKHAALHKMKRERKAAKTLGIIVSVFLICWLPFFTWYLVFSLCGESCAVPEPVVTALFWIGYFNSTLNPIIYAYFNRDFRKAFKKTLRHYWHMIGGKKITKCLGFCMSCCPSCCTCCPCCVLCCGCCVPCCPCCCPQVPANDTFSSDIGLKSAVSSEYVHIEMNDYNQKM